MRSYAVGETCNCRARKHENISSHEVLVITTFNRRFSSGQSVVLRWRALQAGNCRKKMRVSNGDLGSRSEFPARALTTPLGVTWVSRHQNGAVNNLTASFHCFVLFSGCFLRFSPVFLRFRLTFIANMLPRTGDSLVSHLELCILGKLSPDKLYFSLFAASWARLAPLNAFSTSLSGVPCCARCVFTGIHVS